MPQPTNDDDLMAPPRTRVRRRRTTTARRPGAPGGGNLPVGKVSWTAEQKQYIGIGYKFAADLAKIHGVALPTDMPFVTKL